MGDQDLSNSLLPGSGDQFQNLGGAEVAGSQDYVLLGDQVEDLLLAITKKCALC